MWRRGANEAADGFGVGDKLAVNGRGEYFCVEFVVEATEGWRCESEINLATSCCCSVESCLGVFSLKASKRTFLVAAEETRRVGCGFEQPN